MKIKSQWFGSGYRGSNRFAQDYSSFLQKQLVVLLVCCGLWGCVSKQDDLGSDAGCQSEGFLLVRDMFEASDALQEGDVGRGEQLFTSLCSGCHVHGRLSVLAQAVRAATAGAQAPVPPHLACERFQRSYSQAYLAATIKHGGRPEFKAHSMPAWEGVLNDEDIADLVAYIVSIGDVTPAAEP